MVDNLRHAQYDSSGAQVDSPPQKAFDGSVKVQNLPYLPNPLDAWRLQKNTYRLQEIPTPTIFIDSLRGDDSYSGASKSQAWKTLAKLLTAIPPAGTCIGLANDSVFDLVDRISFSSTFLTTLNGTAGAPTIITNYNPGDAFFQRPRIRWKIVPAANQWTFDSAVGKWYFVNPNSRPWFPESYVKLAGNWGQSRDDFPVAALSADYQYRVDDAVNRIYIYSPSNIDPTTYYGGPGSIVLSEGNSGAINFSRCGNYVIIDGLIFEECGTSISFTNFAGTSNLSEFTVQRCSMLDVGRAFLAAQDTSSGYTQSANFLENTVKGVGHHGIHTYCKALNFLIAGNLLLDGNNSRSRGGGVYAQEASGGTSAMANNIITENYVKGWKHNTGDHPHDGAGLYIEVRAKGWTVAKNVITEMHHGIYNNSGMPVTCFSNIMDNVDIPYTVADGNAIGNTDSKFVHNTLLNCGLTVYRTSGALDKAEAPIYVHDNIGTAKPLDHRNNIIHLAGLGVAQRVPATATYLVDSNHIFGELSGNVKLSTGTKISPNNTSSGITVVNTNYSPRVGLAGVSLSWSPRLPDFYGNQSAAPLKGAVF